MDTLILSCGTGGGHNSACTAIEQEMLSRGHTAKTLNPYLLKGERTAAMIDKAYTSLAQKAPALFGGIYRLGDAYRHLPVSSPVYHLNKLMADEVEKYLGENHFDAIVMTHLYPAEIITGMKRKGKKVPTSYFIATDYTCIPFTEETDCDYYIIPSEELRGEYIKRGVPEGKIYPLGIPVKKEFYLKEEKSAVRKRLGLEQDKTYILLAGGSIGAGQIQKIVSTLVEYYDRKTAELIVVCGSHAELYRSMIEKYADECTVLAFTDKMADYIKACDLFVSKPGGLSSTEAAVAGAPLIHVTPIPGCETDNMRFFERRGMSLAVYDFKTQLTDACDRLLFGGEREVQRQNQLRSIPPLASANICGLIESNFNKNQTEQTD